MNYQLFTFDFLGELCTSHTTMFYKNARIGHKRLICFRSKKEKKKEHLFCLVELVKVGDTRLMKSGLKNTNLDRKPDPI